ncbi:MATE family efflux transporter [Pseudoduganella violacea]|uniref:Multidrug-efflux transporter n=1 Tax=Pseudoduganella violacea TaxID=1715466 RepID=A0A7W5B886_9BURK|nr:MATE family efflux transporter [Pseudoduganella violacea]MBB3118015.1 MATE family multidrug resistance protein [Pseudoduganella violacea]
MPSDSPRNFHAIRQEIRALWQLAWPILIAQLAAAGMGASDVAMTGHVNPAELAAVALGASLWIVVFGTLVGLMMPVNALVAHQYGAGALDQIPRVVRQALWMALGIGLLAVAVVNLATAAFYHIGLPDDVAAHAARFVQVISLGLPALTAYRTLYGYSASINQTKPMMIIALGALAHNIVVNWLLVYGHWGLPRLGAIGCAIGTASGLWLMLGGMLWWLRHAPAYRASYPLSHWEGPDWTEIRAMLKLGVPMGVTYFAEMSAFSAVCLLVARFGVDAVAANQITFNFTSLMYVVPFSFGVAMVTRVGHALGEGNPRRARFVSLTGVGVSVGFALLSAALMALFRHEIAAAYVADPRVIDMTAALLLLGAFFQLSDATQVAASWALRGYKVSQLPMIIHLTSFWGVALPLGCLLGLGWLPAWFPWQPQPLAATGFWIGLAAGLTVAAVLLIVLLQRLTLRRIAEAEAKTGGVPLPAERTARAEATLEQT